MGAVPVAPPVARADTLHVHERDRGRFEHLRGEAEEAGEVSGSRRSIDPGGALLHPEPRAAELLPPSLVVAVREGHHRADLELSLIHISEPTRPY